MENVNDICEYCSKKITKTLATTNEPTCLFRDDTNFDLCHWKCVEKMLDMHHYEGIVKGTFTPLEDKYGGYAGRKKMYICRTSICGLCGKYYNTNQKVGVCYEQNGSHQCYHWTCVKRFHTNLPLHAFNGITLHHGGIPEVIEAWHNLDKNTMGSAKRNLSALKKKYANDGNGIIVTPKIYVAEKTKN